MLHGDTKVCTKCGDEKDLSEFHKNRYCKYGVLPSCKKCLKNHRSALNYPRTGLHTKCSICGEVKPAAEFKSRKSNRNGLVSWCNECSRIDDSNRKYSKQGYKNEFGETFTMEDKARIFKGRCDKCGTTDSGERDWDTDHDHETGYVRGIVCHGCNMGTNWDKIKGWGAMSDKYLDDFEERLKTYPLIRNK